MKARLVAVQLKADLGDYLSFDAFGLRVGQVMARVKSALKPGMPNLVVFPEHLGFYLGSIPFHPGEAEKARTFQSFVVSLGGEERSEIQYRLFVKHAIEVWDFYEGLFADVARRFGVYLVAGSLSLPKIERSPHRAQASPRDSFMLEHAQVYNISPVFNPSGRCIGQTPKKYIPEGEDKWIDEATHSDAHPLTTALGPLGVTLCYDGYHHGPVERMDALGCQILCQPVHFPGPGLRFDRTGELVPAYEDFIKLIQGRENIRFGVCSALVGEVFPDRRAEGLSFIARNGDLPQNRWQEALIRLADDPYKDQILAATVTW